MNESLAPFEPLADLAYSIQWPFCYFHFQLLQPVPVLGRMDAKSVTAKAEERCLD